MAFSQSNLFLPLGKVRMGCPLGRSGWVILRGMLGWVRDRGWGLIPSDLFSFSVIILAVYRSICLRGGDASPPLYTVFVPFLGKHVAQVGQARYPTRASTLPHLGTFPSPPVPNIPLFHHTNIFLFLSLSPAMQSPQSAIPSHYLSPHHSPSTSVLVGSYKTV